MKNKKIGVFMYCHHCGKEIIGNYCSQCGTKRVLVDDFSNNINETDWIEEINYQKLLQTPEVIKLISLATKKRKKNISAEEFLNICGDAFKPITGVSLGKIANIVAPIYANLGISTKKKQSITLSKPIGKVIVKLLCFFAEFNQEIVSVSQAKDGCIIETIIPSDMLSWEGTLLVIIHQENDDVSVEAATKIQGQMYDWGKSKRLLTKLFNSLREL